MNERIRSIKEDLMKPHGKEATMAACRLVKGVLHILEQSITSSLNLHKWLWKISLWKSSQWSGPLDQGIIRFS